MQGVSQVRVVTFHSGGVGNVWRLETYLGRANCCELRALSAKALDRKGKANTFDRLTLTFDISFGL